VKDYEMKPIEGLYYYQTEMSPAKNFAQFGRYASDEDAKAAMKEQQACDYGSDYWNKGLRPVRLFRFLNGKLEPVK
jgi:hypothetical protein